jgi:hypothetical protein
VTAVRTRLLLGTVLSLVLTSPAKAVPYAYFVNAEGQLLKLRLDDLSVAALWPLDQTRELGAQFPARNAKGTFLPDLAFDPRLADVYLVVPSEASINSQQPILYRVIRVRLPVWGDVGAQYPLPVRTFTAPRIALGPNGRELYVEYDDPSNSSAGDLFVDEIRVLERVSLRELRSYRSEAPRDPLRLSPGQAYPFFAPETYFPPESETAYGEGRLIQFTESEYRAEWLNFDDYLTAVQRDRLFKKFGVNPQNQRPRVYLASMDAVGRWALLWAKGMPQDETPTDIFVVVDLVARKAVGLIEIPFSVANLLPDGRVLARRLRSPDRGDTGNRGSWSATGEAWIYDPSTGSRIGSFASELLVGGRDEVSFRCAEPTGRFLFFSVVRDERVWLVSIDARSGKARIVNADFWPGDGTMCIFTDEGR